MSAGKRKILERSLAQDAARSASVTSGTYQSEAQSSMPRASVGCCDRWIVSFFGELLKASLFGVTGRAYVLIWAWAIFWCSAPNIMAAFMNVKMVDDRTGKNASAFKMLAYDCLAPLTLCLVIPCCACFGKRGS